jgi:hypothetical protein
VKQIYRIADRTIEIDSLHSMIHRQCEEYLEEGMPDFIVKIDQKDVDFEKDKSAREDAFEDRATQIYSDDYLETLAVYRQISEKMPEYDTMLFHGSVIAVDGTAYLFTAKSGTGKSTHTRLWRKLLGDKAVMVNDDKPLIRIADGRAVVYGTPWSGKHRLNTNISVPIRSICVLHQAKDNSICPVAKREIYHLLLQQMYRPLSRPALIKSLTLLDRLCSVVSLYSMGCNMEPEAAAMSYAMMRSSHKLI